MARRLFSVKRAMNAVVLGTAGTAAVGLLGWPVIDGALIPLAFDCAIDKNRHSGRRNWWAMGAHQEDDLKALREELLQDEAKLILLTGGEIETSTLVEELLCSSDTNGVVLELGGSIDQRILLYATLTSLLDTPGSPFLSKLLLVYIKAVNVFGNLLTGNHNTNHTSFIFYSLFLDHLRTAFKRNYQATGKHSLLVLNHINKATSPVPGTEDDEYLKLCIEELLMVANHFVGTGHASVLLTSTSTSAEEAKKWIASSTQARYTGNETDVKVPPRDKVSAFRRELVSRCILREVVGAPLQGGPLIGTSSSFVPAEMFGIDPFHL